MVKKSSYWMNRTKELMQYAEQQDKVMFQELAKLYGETFKDVQKEVFDFYVGSYLSSRLASRQSIGVIR